MPPNLRIIGDFLERNVHIINGLHDRKYRLPNTHLLTSLFCGHYLKWLTSL